MLGEFTQPLVDVHAASNPSRIGTVVALRPIPDIHHTWEPAPQRMAILALDSGQWAYAWIRAAHPITPGLRVEFREHASDARFPTFTPLHSSSLK